MKWICDWKKKRAPEPDVTKGPPATFLLGLPRKAKVVQVNGVSVVVPEKEKFIPVIDHTAPRTLTFLGPARRAVPNVSDPSQEPQEPQEEP